MSSPFGIDCARFINKWASFVKSSVKGFEKPRIQPSSDNNNSSFAIDSDRQPVVSYRRQGETERVIPIDASESEIAEWAHQKSKSITADALLPNPQVQPGRLYYGLSNKQSVVIGTPIIFKTDPHQQKPLSAGSEYGEHYEPTNVVTPEPFHIDSQQHHQHYNNNELRDYSYETTTTIKPFSYPEPTMKRKLIAVNHALIFSAYYITSFDYIIFYH